MTYFDASAGAALKSAFDDLVLAWPDVCPRTMFGCPSYRVEGTLFAVLLTDAVALTALPADRHEQLATVFETGPFEPGRQQVKQWVQVTVEEVSALKALGPYIRASYETARASATEK